MPHSYALMGRSLSYTIRMETSMRMLIQTWPIRAPQPSQAQRLVQGGPIRILAWLLLCLHYMVSLCEQEAISLAGFSKMKQHRFKAARWQLPHQTEGAIGSMKKYMKAKHNVKQSGGMEKDRALTASHTGGVRHA